MSQEPEKEVHRHFTRLDKDGNGYLAADELKLLLLDMGFAPVAAKEEAENMLEAADENNDGQVDFEEFKQVWHRKLLSQHDQYIHRVFLCLMIMVMVISMLKSFREFLVMIL